MKLHTVAGVCVAIACLFVTAADARAAEVKVFGGGVMRPVLSTVSDEFERATGHKIIASYAPAPAVVKRVLGGETADVTFLARPALEQLVKQGKIASDSTTDILYSSVGIAIRAGAPKPDISSVEALRRSLLAAKSVAYFDPAAGGLSGIHFARVLEQLGIAEQMKLKSKLAQGNIAEYAAKGEVELAVQQVNELLAVPGVELVGPLPPELQNPSAFTIVAGIFQDAKEPKAARALVDFLTSPALDAVYRKQGLEPARR